jgi:hypothetical protein
MEKMAKHVRLDRKRKLSLDPRVAQAMKGTTP